VEARIHALTSEVGKGVAGAVEPRHLRALLLIGGYGRGEGGVEVRDGVEHAHNNLDFLLVTRGIRRGALGRTREHVSQALDAIRERHDVGLDLGVVSEASLLRAPCLVMWHDMHFGHRTVCGDPDFAPSLTRFATRPIPAWDVRNLLVNRGTLLLINGELLDAEPHDPRVARTVVRHLIKAIIGYGDALLYFNGLYHWSYVEKQARMRRLAAVPRRFQELYDSAMDFRFSPSYERYAGMDLRAFTDELEPILAQVHLSCERMRLGRPELTWEEYAEVALRALVGASFASPRDLARGARNLRRRPVAMLDLSAIAALGARLGGVRELLPIAFPGAAYRSADDSLARALAGGSGSRAALRRRYLELWGRHVDVNFRMPAVRRDPTATETRAAA
jgi:hypothetical protein